MQPRHNHLGISVQGRIQSQYLVSTLCQISKKKIEYDDSSSLMLKTTQKDSV